jgi:mono/diheme cytochrome c family protein
MISRRMKRPFRVLFVMSALAAVVALVSACGTEKIEVSKADQTLYRGAVLFSQRCSGCHTLSYAATHGSAANARSAEVTNGPNLDQRCERPVTRVLYAIVNGGFSGAIMPQNVVVGQDAIDVAQFVSKYAGSKAPKSPGVPVCSSQSIGSIPPLTSSTASTTASASSTTTAASKSTTKKPAASGKSSSAHKKSKKPKK